MAIETLLISTGGGALLGYACAKALKFIFKIAIVVVGLIVLVLVWLSYKGWIDVRWQIAADQTKQMAYNASSAVLHAINNTVTSVANHPATIGSQQGIPIAMVLGFVPGFAIGIRR